MHIEILLTNLKTLHHQWFISHRLQYYDLILYKLNSLELRSGERAGHNLLIISSQNATINAKKCKEITAPFVIGQVFRIVSEYVLQTVSSHGHRKRTNILDFNFVFPCIIV